MAAEPLAKIALRRRVPSGFHGLFVPNSALPAAASAAAAAS